VIETVFTSATVEVKVQVETPEAVLREQVPYALVDPVSVALKVGTIPATPTLLESFKVIVTVEVELPLAVTGPVAEILEFAATTEPGEKTTVPPMMVGLVILKTFVSAVVDFKVQVETPEALDAEHAPKVLLLPVAVKVGTVPAIALLFASFKVMVMIELLMPSFSTGLEPVIVV
jgi:hypothetical protein